MWDSVLIGLGVQALESAPTGSKSPALFYIVKGLYDLQEVTLCLWISAFLTIKRGIIIVLYPHQS